MGMPQILTLVRHGESEANVVQKKVKKGELATYPANYGSTPDREFRLSELGREQTKLTGQFLGREYPQGFDVIFTSDHTRAKETAALVCLSAGWPHAKIKVDPQFGERHWGNFHMVEEVRRTELFALRKRDPLHFPMPDGETLLEARARTRILLERCSRQYEGKRILVFTHGEYIECLWSEIGHMRTEEQKEFFSGPLGDLKNCQIVEFKSDDSGKFKSVRSSNPHFGISSEWMTLQQKDFTPEELLREVSSYPSIL